MTNQALRRIIDQEMKALCVDDYEVEDYLLELSATATALTQIIRTLPGGYYYLDLETPVKIETYVNNIQSLSFRSDNGAFQLERFGTTNQNLYVRGRQGMLRHSQNIFTEIVPNVVAGTVGITLPFKRVQIY